MTIDYRPDIDGLRAVAVSAVILYHAHVPGFSGGFVGVDVFFVVSGFLITSLLITDAGSHGISIRDFYDRRVRRIFPALFVVMAATIGVGWFVYAPDDFESLGRSAGAASLFYSNIWFWLDSGYFEADESQRPLLHTWSLAVEEQFYLVFPIVLIVIFRFFYRYRIVFLAVVGLASLLLSAVMVSRAPSATFYLLPTRAWELLIGSLLALRPIRLSSANGIPGAMVACGLAGVIGCTAVYTDETVFPGVSAVPPTLATALVISGGQAGDSWARRLLASSPFVLAGKISYSLYLWHFPLLAYASYLSVDALSASEKALVVTACVVLSLASWKFIEIPARRRRGDGASRRVFTLALIAMISMVGCALAIRAYRGFPARLSPAEREVLSASRDFNADRGDCSTLGVSKIDEARLCSLGAGSGAASFVLWGDSHGEVLRPAVSAVAARAGRHGVYLGSSGCVPLTGAATPGLEKCHRMAKSIVKWIQTHPKVDTVIISARWALWESGRGVGDERGLQAQPLMAEIGAADSTAGTELQRALAATVVALSEDGRRHIWLVGPIPEIGVDVPRSRYVQLRGWDSDVAFNPTRALFDLRQRDVVEAIRDATNRFQNVQAVWPHDVLCGAAECLTTADGRILYFDDNHLSRAGARFIESVLAPALAASGASKVE